jgi:hypothetical protein
MVRIILNGISEPALHAQHKYPANAMNAIVAMDERIVSNAVPGVVAGFAATVAVAVGVAVVAPPVWSLIAVAIATNGALTIPKTPPICDNDMCNILSRI